MSIVQLSFAAFTVVGLLSIIGIVVIVTGRGPKNLNWKKNEIGRAHVRTPVTS